MYKQSKDKQLNKEKKIKGMNVGEHQRKAEGETTVMSHSALPLAKKANTLICKQVMVVARIKTNYSVLVRREDFLPWPRILS